jgi:uncharacterized protein
MNADALILRTAAFVKLHLANAEGGHDWFHTERVWKNARLIAQSEPVDKLVVELAALLHDIADSKFHNGDEEIGPRVAGEFLDSEEVTSSVKDHVVQIIKHISFKGGNERAAWSSPELYVVQDADRLDAIGAIGIARTFNYGGFRGRALYDPAVAPDLNMTKEQYKNSTAPTINHFYEKLLLLKDRMNTETAREIATSRHGFMTHFLDQFYAEWNGER